KKYTIATNDKGPDGDLGWVKRESLDPSIAYWVYGLKVGETSQPVQDREGWHIVQSVERKPVEPPAYEPMSGLLRRQIFNVRSGERTEQLLALLRLQNGVVYDSANAKYAAGKFNESVKYKQEAMAATFEIDGSTPDLAPEDTSRTLATWKGH